MACAVEGEGYVRHCAAMLDSLLRHHDETIVRIDYLHGEDTSARSRRRLESMVRGRGGEITFHLIADRPLEGLPVRGFTGKATWYRFLLPELLGDVDRVLYLDSDLLVLGSLLPLWETDLEGHLLGAVTNVMMRHDLDRALWLGLPSRDAYFNAGVLLIDLEQMRRERTQERLLTFAHENPDRLGWRDQDVLNLVLHDRRLHLHPRWNCMNSIVNFPWASDYFSPEVLAEARADPAVRHFEGPAMNKPWHLLCDPELRALYAEHRRHTPWPRVRTSGRTPRNVLRYARSVRRVG